jgi:formate-dependent nitrite reductase membrane component NrfD
MTELDVARHSHLIDPHLHVWGWEVPLYLFLGGMAAGLMILGSVLALREPDRSTTARRLAFAAPVLVTLGMGALFLDLTYKLHVWRFYLAFRWTSPMSWGAWILLLVYPVTLALALAGLDDADAGRAVALLDRARLGGAARTVRAFGQRHLAGLAWTHLLVGAGLGIYTGILLSTLGARALWGTALLGPLFLVSGFSTGAAFLMTFRVDARERHLLARWDELAIGVELVVLALLLVGLAAGGAEAKQAVHLLLGGRYAAAFLGLVVVAGLLVPLLVNVLEARLRLRLGAAAPALVMVGGFALRWIFVAAGQL